LKANGKSELEESIRTVKEKLRKKFSADVQIRIHSGATLEGKALYEAMEKMRGRMLDILPKSVAAAPKKEQKPQDPEAVYGKPFKGNTIPMKDLNLDMGFVIVEGRVFNIEHKELTKRNAWVINFDVTDNTSSIRISRFMEKKEAEPILQSVKNGSVFKIQGKLIIDNFTNEMVLRPNAIMAGSMEKRKDTAEGMKRVELHMHTSMSNMDALTSTSAAIKQAAAWGHRAIAITDHGCVQSFTDALHTVEAWGGGPKIAGTDEVIKVLYGCEGYYINDVDDRLAVCGAANMSFDDEYVAFDLETTGLHRHDTIIEIGAVLMKNGVELDRFQTFVDPGQKLHPKTIELTGITDDMLEGAPTIDQVIPQLKAFVGERVLVAHNADFDINFVRRACQDLGIQWNMTSLDTLTISQNMLPHLSRYRLDVVAKEFDLGDFNHHRAGDDA
jgi:DNA polymerase-3 subunit alpha (Gram-positive type)